MVDCAHCGSQVPPGSADEFCCRGCRAAFDLVKGSGLAQYYRRRCVDPEQRPLRPESDAAILDFTSHVFAEPDGARTLHLMVEGLHCAACVWLIESLIGRQPQVEAARVNMTTRRLVVTWRGDEALANDLLAPVLAVGYRLVPFDPARLKDESLRHEKELLRAMAVAGFAAGNVMLFSVSVWAGMDSATRDFFHWISAAIALPAILYCVRPFLRSALTALRAKRTNMDVPISIGVVLTAGMSLHETMNSGPHAYFDAAISLLFFLLVGRYLDSRARGRARASAEHLLSLGATAVTVVEPDGTRRMVPPAQVATGATVIVAAGERIGVDGRVVEGRSDIDTSLISGETVPTLAEPGIAVFAGTLNLAAPLRVEVTAVGEGTLLAEIVRMMEVAEQGRARHVALADRVARYYSPVVHLMALSTFLGWVWLTPLPWQQALLIAVSVLIVTCPCALALAVPVVQVVASGRLLRQGILLKSATALERLAEIDTVMFDKTGTLTLGKPELLHDGGFSPDDLAVAAGLAGASRHPLARALAAAAPGAKLAADVREIPGKGLEAGAIRLGSRRFVGVADEDGQGSGPELWLARPGRPPLRFCFRDQPRPDAAPVVADLRRQGFALLLASGDRRPVVAALAGSLGIEEWRAGQTPSGKCALLDEQAARGRRVLMVGDGLNDAPALAAAHVSLSPSTAVDVSQTAADVVFQGLRLGPVVEAIAVARRADRLVKQNFVLAFLYNVVTVPLAVMGLVTPLIAAIAMSTSSVVVIANALRLAGRR